MKIIFLGSGQFAVPILQHILKETDWDVGCVVCQPPKKAGRGKKQQRSPVHKYADTQGLTVYAPETLKDGAVQQKLATPNADIFITAAYGKIIPKEVFALPPHQTVNVHPSLLPLYRGPSPIQGALLEGRKETGVTLMQIDDKLDHGPLLSQKTFSIEPEDTYNTLEPRLARRGAEMLVRDIPRYSAGDLSPTPQQHEQATYTQIINKKDGHIDWASSAEDIYNQWRAFVRWPGVYTFAKRKGAKMRVVVNRMLPTSELSQNAPGTFWQKGKHLFVQCGSGALEIITIQPEGKQEMSAQSFVNGYSDIINTPLK